MQTAVIYFMSLCAALELVFKALRDRFKILRTMPNTRFLSYKVQVLAFCRDVFIEKIASILLKILERSWG